MSMTTKLFFWIPFVGLVILFVIAIICSIDINKWITRQDKKNDSHNIK